MYSRANPLIKICGSIKFYLSALRTGPRTRVLSKVREEIHIFKTYMVIDIAKLFHRVACLESYIYQAMRS